MKKIITISREFGAGGGTIGKLVAKRLGYDYYDRDIILDAARESSMPVENFLRLDETVTTNFGFAQSLFDMLNKPMSEKIFEDQKNIIRKVGEKGSCVIVGRNANWILGEYDHCLHVYAHGKTQWRVRRMMEFLPELSEEQVLEKLKVVDKMRTKYCTHFTNTDFGSAKGYDLAINTSTIGIERAVDIICELAKDD